MKLAEIATRITAHLAKFEADPVENAKTAFGVSPYYQPHAFKAGSRVGIVYVSYHGATKLPRVDAERYLAMLDGGYVGRHFEAFREGATP